MKKIIMLLVFAFAYSFGYAQDDSNDSTMSTSVEYQKEMNR